MAITNHERVGKALDLLKAGLGPFIEREFRSVYQEFPGHHTQFLPQEGGCHRGVARRVSRG